MGSKERENFMNSLSRNLFRDMVLEDVGAQPMKQLDDSLDLAEFVLDSPGVRGSDLLELHAGSPVWIDPNFCDPRQVWEQIFDNHDEKFSW